GGVRITTENENKIEAGGAIVATNSPINDYVALHSKLAPYRTYAMGFRLPRDKLEDALYWDTLDPYHYVRLHPLNTRSDVLIVGGEDHKSGTADDAEQRYAALEQWIRELVPELGKETHRWSGQVLESLD